MNRLQKKCVIATTGFHLLLLVILLVGPAFFWAREKPDDTPVLDMIPANLIDAATTGVGGAEPPPAPTPPPPTPPAPTPPAPTPPPPKPVPVPEKFVEPVKPVKPVKETVQKPATPKVNMEVTERIVPKNNPTQTTTSPDNSKAINSTLRALRKNLSSATEIAPIGNSSAAAANYGQVVKSVYEQAWVLPDDVEADQANTKVRVTIASDGTVISARIITGSGDAKLDASVQRTLDRVQFIAPFPSGSTDKERTYIINFNPQIKRMLG
jgi:TonB family protein